ncbi:hypothetical protein HF1_13640 [Mycoplasma haemofelis str. Langford 1]|uniref:Uncharacterized protein n=1 Tax=Mycoplasma haemofelis (strain Langford 1) TaxID=941640 RepID=E8ZJQ1_MYCHL|nr:hypothetical protein [Mycoplasma haemofelis]CBY93372.1 hypothetical protein HF1_13640 [Mycoplasma haemofelis str. Langford 1]
MAASLKTLLPVAGVGGTGALGGYYMLSDSTTIRDKLKQDIKGLPRKILDREGLAEWSEWKKVYDDNSLTPKIDGVTSSEALPKWCKDTLDQKLDKSKYDLAKVWCIVNTSSLRGEASLKGTSLISETGNDVVDKFKKAWKKVKDGKSNAGVLDIGDDKVTGESVQEEAGGKALQTWCTTRYSWLMYKLEARKDLDKVIKWCNEDAGKA